MSGKQTKNQSKGEKWRNEDSDKLFEAILSLKNKEEARNFFRDLLTESEIIEFSQRWKAARLLARGMSYSGISRQTWLSSRTIARVQKWLKKGKDGYRLMINRLYK
jgi:TrpR-related protein YerC/YecD